MVFKEHCKAYIMEYSIRKRESTKDRLLFMALIKTGKFFLYSPTPCLPCSKLADYSKFGAKMGLGVFCFHTVKYQRCTHCFIPNLKNAAGLLKVQYNIWNLVSRLSNMISNQVIVQGFPKGLSKTTALLLSLWISSLANTFFLLLQRKSLCTSPFIVRQKNNKFINKIHNRQG